MNIDAVQTSLNGTGPTGESQIGEGCFHGQPAPSGLVALFLVPEPFLEHSPLPYQPPGQFSFPVRVIRGSGAKLCHHLPEVLLRVDVIPDAPVLQNLCKPAGEFIQNLVHDTAPLQRRQAGFDVRQLLQTQQHVQIKPAGTSQGRLQADSDICSGSRMGINATGVSSMPGCLGSESRLSPPGSAARRGGAGSGRKICGFLFPTLEG